MGRNANPIPATLFPDSEQSVLAAGNTVDDLGVGQIGVFNADTGESIGAATSPMPRRFFIAEGLDTNGDGTVDDIAQSAGQGINVKDVVGYESLCYRSGLSQIVQISDIAVKCERDYLVQINIRDAEAFDTYGYNPVRKVFAVNTECCDDCGEDNCKEGNCATFAINLKDAINADPDGIFTAELFDPADSALGDEAITDAEAIALTEAQEPTCPVVRITANYIPLKEYCGIPFTHTFPRGTAFDVSYPEWDCELPTATTLQELGFEEVAGKDARYEEFWAQGIEVSPYRLTESGVNNTAPYRSASNGRYNVINLSYDLEGHSGGRYYTNAAQTIIYFACGFNVGESSFANVLDNLLPGFEAQAATLNVCDGCTEDGASGPTGGLE